MAKILLIDDDEDFIAINRIILEKNGYEVQAANGPEEAWEKIITWKPDMLCLDVMMPTGTEGFHFAYKVRKHEETKLIPILMITSIHEKSDFTFSPETDGDYLPVEKFVEKPIPPDVLLTSVKELLGKAHDLKQKKEKDKGIGLKKD